MGLAWQSAEKGCSGAGMLKIVVKQLNFEEILKHLRISPMLVDVAGTYLPQLPNRP